MTQFDEVSRSLNEKPLNLDFQQYEKYTKRSWLEGTNEEGMGLGTQISTVLGNVFHNFLAFTAQVNTFLFGPNDKKDQWKWYDNDRVAVSIGKKLLKVGLYIDKAGDCSKKIVTVKDGSVEAQDQNMVDVIKTQLRVVKKLCDVLKNAETSKSQLDYVDIKINNLDVVINPVNEHVVDVIINNNENVYDNKFICNKDDKDKKIINYENRIVEGEKISGYTFSNIIVNVNDEDSVEEQKQDGSVKSSDLKEKIDSKNESSEGFKKLDEPVSGSNKEIKEELKLEETKESLGDKVIKAPIDDNKESQPLNHKDVSDEDFVKDFQELFAVEKSQINLEINEAKSIDASSKVVEEDSLSIDEVKIKKINVKSLFSSPIVYDEKDRKEEQEALEKAEQEKKAAELAALEQVEQEQKVDELAALEQTLLEEASFRKLALDLKEIELKEQEEAESAAVEQVAFEQVARKKEASEFAANNQTLIVQTNQWTHRVNSYLQMLHRLKTKEVYSKTIFPEKIEGVEMPSALVNSSAIVEFKPTVDESEAIVFNMSVNLSDDMFEISTDDDRQSIVANTTIKIEIIDLIFNINILGDDEDVNKFINFLGNLSERKKIQLMKKAVEAAKQESTPESAKLSFGQKFIELLRKAPLEKEAFPAIEGVAEDFEVKVQDVTNEILEQPGIQKQAEIHETVLSREEKIKGLKEEIAELMLWASLDKALRDSLGQLLGRVSPENRRLQGYITLLNKKDIPYLEFISVAKNAINLINTGLKQYDFPDEAKIAWTDRLLSKLEGIKEADAKMKEEIAKNKAIAEEFKKGKLEELKREVSYLIDAVARHTYLKDSFGQFLGKNQGLNECINKLTSEGLTQAELFDNLLSATSLVSRGFDQSANPFAQSFEILNGKVIAIAELDIYIDELEKKYQAL